eukprot:2512140-Pyramimonas_sp.AAC.1
MARARREGPERTGAPGEADGHAHRAEPRRGPLERRCSNDYQHATALPLRCKGPGGKPQKISIWRRVYPPNMAEAISK